MLSNISINMLAAISLFGWVAATAHTEEHSNKNYPVLSGVGLALKMEEDRIYVAKVVPNSPAEKSGLVHAGDRLSSVEFNGKENILHTKTVGEAVSLIRGPVGTELVLTIIPSNSCAPIRVALTRAPLEIAGVADSTYDAFIGKPMPDLELTSLAGMQTSDIAAYRGKIVVLEFWASWCAACYAPVGKMQTIIVKQPEWKGKVELIAIAVDSDLLAAARVVNEKKWHNTPHFAVDAKKLEAIGLSIIPLIIVIDGDGTIAAVGGAHSLEIEKEVIPLLDK